MAATLKRLPNYACTVTTERLRRETSAKRLELVDRLRLEVGFVGYKELFAWPGAGSFEERKLTEMAPPGVIGSGSFALHAWSLFLGKGAVFKYAGEEARDGRRMVRYDYQVPCEASVYRIAIPPHQATVAYQGAAWFDAESLDLVRLEVRAEKIPPELRLAEVTESISYCRTVTEGSRFLLPQASELRMVDSSGQESRNRSQFSGCRQFATESEISFQDVNAPDQGAQRKPPARVGLPAGLPIELELETELDSQTTFVGDPVTARVDKDVKADGKVVVPKGAVASGRVIRLDKPSRYFVAGLQFLEIRFGKKTASVRARLAELRPSMILVGAAGQRVNVTDAGMIQDGLLLVAARDRLRLPRGLRMIWKTVP